MKTAHLVKVITQTVWVEVDSVTGNAEEKVGAAVHVTADAWPGFYAAWQKSWEEIVGTPKAAAAEIAGVEPASVFASPLRVVPEVPEVAAEDPF